jgi:hypothetical protein
MKSFPAAVIGSFSTLARRDTVPLGLLLLPVAFAWLGLFGGPAASDSRLPPATERPPWEGAPDGPWVVKYPDGTTRTSGQIVSGRPAGYWRFWRADGSLQEEGDFPGGHQQGAWLYWDREGRILCVQAFKDSFEHGMRTCFHPNGRKKTQGEMRHGKQVGTWVEWDEQGREVRRKKVLGRN